MNYLNTDMMYICPKCKNILASSAEEKPICNCCGNTMLLTNVTTQEYLDNEKTDDWIVEQYSNGTYDNQDYIKNTLPSIPLPPPPKQTVSSPVNTESYTFHYVVSFLIPFLGFILGANMLSSTDFKRQSVGKTCIILGVASVIISGIIFFSV